MADAFYFQGRIYAAKQPGQTLLGALAYFFLRLFGLNYVDHYLLTSALVTFFTISLITAMGGVAVFKIASELTGGDSLFWPTFAALTYGLGTTAFVYSGIALHDPLAASFLTIAFYFAILAKQQPTTNRRARLLAGAAGLFIGLTITTSMLPFVMACALALYLVLSRRWDVSIAGLLGVALGLLPMLVYDAVCFGNPFLLANAAGGYQDTFLYFDVHNLISKLWFYTRMVTFYEPVVWAGIIGLWFFPPRLWQQKLLIVALLSTFVFQILNIESQGGCQYGPRYLLPALPFACVGLAGFQYLRGNVFQKPALVSLIGLAVLSFFINLVGALYTAMYCDTNRYVLWPGLEALRSGEWKALPLGPWLAIPLVASVLLLARSMLTFRRTPRSI